MNYVNMITRIMCVAHAYLRTQRNVKPLQRFRGAVHKVLNRLAKLKKNYGNRQGHIFEDSYADSRGPDSTVSHIIGLLYVFRYSSTVISIIGLLYIFVGVYILL